MFVDDPPHIGTSTVKGKFRVVAHRCVANLLATKLDALSNSF